MTNKTKFLPRIDLLQLAIVDCNYGTHHPLQEPHIFQEGGIIVRDSCSYNVNYEVPTINRQRSKNII